MANKTRTSKSGSASPRGGVKRPGGAEGSKGKGGTPKRELSREEPPSRAGDYVVPGVLAVLLVIVVSIYVKVRNRTPSEPAPTANAESSATGDQAGANPAAGTAGAPIPSPQTPPPPPPPPAQPEAQAQDVTVNPLHRRPDSPDPMHGQFSLTQATAGLPPGNTLVADIQTSMGAFQCTLMPDRAPITVANFVGLARGLRDFWDPVAGRWTRRPFYDGSVFHRVIPEFMVQGGDILRSGQGDPGYEIQDENVRPHDQPGLLCMANHGPNTGGAQFFILEAARPHLDTSYSIFGRCTPTDLVGRIARVPRNQRDTPLAPVYIQSVRVHR
jgi:peptidyl-prolyl cis-trans isomerase A (cyclophilin A)